ncbi:MAG: hypothetical protein WBV28_01015 [Terracidiphilus sp.]
MIDAVNNTGSISVVWQYIGPLIGVGFGYWISDRLWDRQKQWELKRDVVLDVVRALADLEGAVSEFYGASSKPPVGLPQGTEEYFSRKKYEALKHLTECSASFQRAHSVADVAIGGELSRNLSEYFQCAHSFLGRMQSGLSSSEKSIEHKELAKCHNRVILSARKALKIKDAGDLPVLDYDNESLTTDN